MLWLLLLLVSLPGWAAELSDAEYDLYSRSRRQLNAGNCQDAYQGFMLLFLNHPDNPDINFKLGLSAFACADYESAVMAYERVLFLKPDAARVRLELARSYFELGSYEQATRLFEEVLEQNPPEGVKYNVYRFLGEIESAVTQHIFSGRISLGYDGNDNANVAPDSNNIFVRSAVGNLPVSVPGSEYDNLWTSAVNFNYAYHRGKSPLSFKLSLDEFSSTYMDEDNLDVTYLAARSGLGIQLGSSGLDLYGQAAHMNLDHKSYFRSSGIGCSLMQPIHARWQLNFDLGYSNRDYYKITTQDARNLTLYSALIYSFGPDRLAGGLLLEREHADDDLYSYRRMIASLNYARQLPWDLILSSGYWYHYSKYDEINTLFGRKRHDKLYSAECSISKILWREQRYQLSLGLKYSYTRAKSNLEVYTYRRNLASSVMTFSF